MYGDGDNWTRDCAEKLVTSQRNRGPLATSESSALDHRKLGQVEQNHVTHEREVQAEMKNRAAEGTKREVRTSVT
jgi:phage terminase Nu1 subunit (DNA packaging protein)